MSRRGFFELVAGLAATAVILASLVIALALPGPEVDSPAVAGSTVGGPAEGISVHGQWVIQVRESDGHLVRSYEFDNAFTGATRIADFLAHTKTSGSWRVYLSNTDSSLKPCYNANTQNPMDCFIAQGVENVTSAASSANLTVTSPGDTVVLSGSVTANGGGQINLVSTKVFGCPPAIASSDCHTFTSTSTMYEITSTQLGSAIDVASGQEVQVTVTITIQ